MTDVNEASKPESEATYQSQNHPHAWIHWKASDVNMELYCYCGVQSSIRGYAAHQVQCPSCHARYICEQNIRLTPVTRPLADLPPPIIGEMQ